jgi:hypothetical protein
MLDYHARDTKIAQKLEKIYSCPSEVLKEVIIKALRTLYHLGVKHAREELDWCQTCLSKGYVDHSGIRPGTHAYDSNGIQRRHSVHVNEDGT